MFELFIMEFSNGRLGCNLLEVYAHINGMSINLLKLIDENLHVNGRNEKKRGVFVGDLYCSISDNICSSSCSRPNRFNFEGIFFAVYFLSLEIKIPFGI